MTLSAEEYLAIDANVQRLVAHNPRILKKVWGAENFNDDPVVLKVTINGPEERSGLSTHLDGFDGPDFRDGHVTLLEAAEAVFGPLTDPEGDDAFLVKRVRSTVSSVDFSVKYGPNGFGYTVVGDVIRRDTRRTIAFDRLGDRITVGAERAAKVAIIQGRGIKNTCTSVSKLDPESASELRALEAEGRVQISSRVALEIGAGE